jgi:hypothetical protein
VTGAAATLLAAPLGAARTQASLDTLLDRAGAYAARFERTFSNVVAEERYEQMLIPVGTTYVGGPRMARREMVSDFLLVRLPDTSDWLPFRDVFEVDHQRVRDREDRLTRLFLQPSATSAERAAEITEESARYNIGIVRTVNHPLLAFHALRAAHRERFGFTGPVAGATAGPGIAVVSFAEQARPSLIRGPGNQDMPMRGRLWIDADRGTVMRTEVLVDSGGVSASIVTTFEQDAATDLAIPIEMREEYRYPNGTRVMATAAYGQFRQFGVEVTDSIGQPVR